jgi:hypothetical protein
LEVQSLEPAETGKIACRLCAALTDNFKDPNNNINRNNNYLKLDSTYVFKIDGIYELPWKLSTSVNFQHYTGFPLQPTEIFNVPNGQGVGVGESVIFQPAGGQRLPSVNMLNLKLSRDFVIIWAPNGMAHRRSAQKEQSSLLSHDVSRRISLLHSRACARRCMASGG